jgi:hypothetical protein
MKNHQPHQKTDKRNERHDHVVGVARFVREMQAATALQYLGDGTARLHFSDKARNTYNMIMSFIPLVCLLVGLMVLHEFHDDQSAHELAEIDSALLVDDLPPQAYADPAFLDFLKNQPSSKE